MLGLNGEATRESVLAHAGFEVDGVAERVGVELIEGEARDKLVAELPYWLRPEGPTVVLKARQAFPNKAKVRLVWGAGIASPSGVATEQDQVLEFTVRPVVHRQSVTCERENPKADCIPLTPIEVRFSAPVAWDQAQQVVLEGPNDDRAQAQDARRAGRVRHQPRASRRRFRNRRRCTSSLPARSARRCRPAAGNAQRAGD